MLVCLCCSIGVKVVITECMRVIVLENSYDAREYRRDEFRVRRTRLSLDDTAGMSTLHCVAVATPRYSQAYETNVTIALTRTESGRANLFLPQISSISAPERPIVHANPFRRLARSLRKPKPLSPMMRARTTSITHDSGGIPSWNLDAYSSHAFS